MGLFNWKNGKDGNTPINATNLNQAQQLIVDTIYPVGSIYTSINETDPKNLFGGTWERIEGRFLLGAGTPEANTDNYFGNISDFKWHAVAGSTGGQDYHRLTTDEIPPHQHFGLYWNGMSSSFNQGGASGYCISWISGSNDDEEFLGTGTTGNGAVHNNMPPYLAVYMWKRIA